MRRLTVDKSAREMNMTELAHNCMVAIDGWAWYRDYETEMDLRNFIRDYNIAVSGDPLPEDNDELYEELMDNLQYGFDDIAGQVAFTYRLMWALADMREALKAYEDTGLIPVEEKLPKEKEDVLVCTKFGWILIAWYGPNGQRWYITPSDAGITREDIVAWMPLPEPYRPELLREAGTEAGQDAAAPVLQSAT